MNFIMTILNILEEQAIRGPQSEIDKRNNEIKIFEKEIKELRNVYDAKKNRQAPAKDGHIIIPEVIIPTDEIKIYWKKAFSECNYKELNTFAFKFNQVDKAYAFFNAENGAEIIEKFNIRSYTGFDVMLYIAETLSNYYLQNDERNLLAHDKIILLGFNENKFKNIHVFVLTLENKVPKFMKMPIDHLFDRALIVLNDE